MSEDFNSKKSAGMSRRAFIGTGVAALGGAAIWGLSGKHVLGYTERGVASDGSTKKPILVSPFADYPQDPAAMKQWDPDNGGYLRILNFETGLIDSIPAAVAAHVYNQHPMRPNILLGAAKHAKGAAVIDLSARKNIAHLIAPHRYQLYGHASFSADGKIVLLSAHNDDTGQGGLCVFDCEDWKLLKVVPSGGGRPHDMYLTDDGHLMVVNEISLKNPEMSAVSYMRTSDFEVERSWEIPTVAHALAMGPGRSLFSGFSTIAPTNLICLDFKSGKYKSFLDHPEIAAMNLIGEGLSLCRIGEDVAALTIPDAKKLIVWDLAQDTIRVTPCHHAINGLATLNGQIYANDNKNHLYKFASDGIPTQIDHPWKNDYANGRHLRIYNV